MTRVHIRDVLRLVPGAPPSRWWWDSFLRCWRWKQWRAYVQLDGSYRVGQSTLAADEIPQFVVAHDFDAVLELSQ